MREHSLNPLQQKLLEMLKWFDSFCRENNLRYYALGGTMLGAVRHEGFIPWDDDVDVGMPRADYDRLAEMMACLSPNKYRLETPYSEAEDYCYPISKLYDVSTTLVENKRHNVRRGVFIDIFPLDGLGNTEAEASANFKKINKAYKLYLLHIAGIRQGRSFYKNAAVLLMRIVPSGNYSNRNKRIELDRMCSEFSFYECVYGGNSLGAWGEKEIMPIKLMGTPVEYKFEDMKVFGVEFYDEYLTHLYGNWRQLPPIEKQISQHDFLELDLNSSYKT